MTMWFCINMSTFKVFKAQQLPTKHDVNEQHLNYISKCIIKRCVIDIRHTKWLAFEKVHIAQPQ